MCSTPWPHPLHGPTRCGQCMECRLAYSREWAIRMCHELRYHERSCMLNLTYRDADLPRFGQLVKPDLQKFFKRLRKSYGRFRYVACGEYGDLKRRPHYHVAVFGLDFAADRVQWGESINGDPTFISPDLHSVWTAGTHLIGTLNFESCAYIARYICKRVSGPNCSPLPLACDPETGELIFPEPEFLLQSRKPPIGDKWFREFFSVDAFPHGRVITDQRSPAPIPTAYKRRLNAMDKIRLRVNIEKNLVASAEHRRLEDSPARRNSRSIYAKARTGLFARDMKDL